MDFKQKLDMVLFEDFDEDVLINEGLGVDILHGLLINPVTSGIARFGGKFLSSISRLIDSGRGLKKRLPKKEMFKKIDGMAALHDVPDEAVKIFKDELETVYRY